MGSRDYTRGYPTAALNSNFKLHLSCDSVSKHFLRRSHFAVDDDFHGYFTAVANARALDVPIRFFIVGQLV